MKRIIKHGVPDWLLLLPAGKYTIPEIADITKQKEGNVYVRMRVLNVERIHSRRLNYPSKIYVWLGAEHYLNEMAEINLKSEKKIRRKIDKEIELIFKFIELGFDYLSGEE